MWNIFTIAFCVIALLFNSYLWFIYTKKTNKKERKKDGWNSCYLIATLLLVTVLFIRIGKL